MTSVDTDRYREKCTLKQMSKDTLDRRKIDDRIHKQAGNVPSKILERFSFQRGKLIHEYLYLKVRVSGFSN